MRGEEEMGLDDYDTGRQVEEREMSLFSSRL